MGGAPYKSAKEGVGTLSRDYGTEDGTCSTVLKFHCSMYIQAVSCRL